MDERNYGCPLRHRLLTLLCLNPCKEFAKGMAGINRFPKSRDHRTMLVCDVVVQDGRQVLPGDPAENRRIGIDLDRKRPQRQWGREESLRVLEASPEVLLASARHPNPKRQWRLKRRTGLRDATAQRE